MPANRPLEGVCFGHHARFGKQSEEVLRAAVVARLRHERRLGELLAGSVQPTGGRGQKKPVIPDDQFVGLPGGVTKNLSSNAQALASAPASWFEETVTGIADGTQHRAVKEVYLRAKRQAAGIEGARMAARRPLLTQEA